MRSSLLVIPFYHFSVSIAGNYFIWVVWITMMADYFTFRSYFWNIWSLTSCQQQSKIGPVWNCWAFGTVCPFSLTSQHLTYTNQTKLTLRKEGGTWHQQQLINMWQVMLVRQLSCKVCIETRHSLSTIERIFASVTIPNKQNASTWRIHN